MEDLYDYMDDDSKHWESTFNEKNLQFNKKIKKIKYLNNENTELDKMLNKLEINCKKHNYCISKITKLNGDCFFEVLVYNDLAEDVISIRKMIASLFVCFKNVKGFFKNFPNDTLEDLFNKFTETQIEYTYDLMCCDLICNGSWIRLPTQLIMMVISKCFNINFTIINCDHNNLIIINESNDTDMASQKNIGLGFLPEFHYIGISRNI